MLIFAGRRGVFSHPSDVQRTWAAEERSSKNCQHESRLIEAEFPGRRCQIVRGSVKNEATFHDLRKRQQFLIANKRNHDRCYREFQV